MDNEIIKPIKVKKKRWLVKNWKEVLKKAWSIKLILIASAIKAVELILPMVTSQNPSIGFVIFSLLFTFAAGVFRLIYQEDLDED